MKTITDWNEFEKLIDSGSDTSEYYVPGSERWIYPKPAEPSIFSTAIKNSFAKLKPRPKVAF
jgi:hypothetical protein